MGLENNSPTTDNPTNSTITEASSMMPDREDLNNDNTVNEVESYFQYQIDLKPGQLQVGQGFVVDKVNEGGVDWYLFRVSIKDKRNYTTPAGEMSSFKSIRFFRMLLSDFQDPVVLRFAQLQLSGYSYRKFIGNLDIINGQDLPETYDAKFRVSSVNVEENGPATKGATAIPYVVPPGFVRDQDITTINNARLNEQSMSLCVDNLRPGDARAVFKIRFLISLITLFLPIVFVIISFSKFQPRAGEYSRPYQIICKCKSFQHASGKIRLASFSVCCTFLPLVKPHRYINL